MTPPLEPPLSVSPANRNARLAFLAQLGPFIGLVLIVIFFSVLRSRTFPTLGNAQIILVETAVVATGALGMTMIIISGGIDLSVGSTIALTTVVVALLLRAGWPAWLAALGGTAAAAVCGVVIGLLVTQAHLAPFIVTLGTWGAYRGIAKGLADNTMVRVPGDNWLDHLLQLLGAKQGWMVFPPGIWLTLLMGLIVAAALRYTRLAGIFTPSDRMSRPPASAACR